MSFLQSQFRRGTAAEWTSANPVLLDGEFGWEKDTKKFKVGDGVTTWNALAYGGIKGDTGAVSTTPGPQGEKGWSPILAVVTDSARRVLQITDWTGGAGTKPSVTNQFVGPTGIVGTAAAAVDIRGPQGADGAGGGSSTTVRSVTGATTAANNEIILASAASAAFAVTLPAVASGLVVQVKKTDSTTNSVTVTPASGTIDGLATFPLSTQYASLSVASDGTNWFII